MCSERLHFQKLSFVANVAFLMILAWRSHDIFWLIKLRKSVRILSFSGLYFPALGLNTEKYRVSGKIQTRKTLNTDTFLAVHRLLKVKKILCPESHFYLLIGLFLLTTQFYQQILIEVIWIMDPWYFMLTLCWLSLFL